MKRHLVAMTVMVAGSATVFASLVMMNDVRHLDTPKAERSTSTFEVAPKPPPKKKKPEKREPPKNRKTSANTPPPPTPSLGAAIGTVSLGLPGLEIGGAARGGAGLLGDVKASVMTEDSVDSLPKVRRRQSATYPARARAQGVTGQVTFNVLVGVDGRVERVKVLESSPAGVFDQTALEAIQKWEFEPATYQGKPVKVWARQTMRFDLT
ncbi:MAG: energy transducer TonB [bacterium]